MYRPLYSEVVGLLKYIHGQVPGDMLKASIKGDGMVGLYLSAKVLRQIASLVKEIERETR